MDGDSDVPFMVVAGVDADRRLARAAVADDEPALAASVRDDRVVGLERRLQRALDRPAIHHAGGVALDRPGLRAGDGTLGGDGLAESVDDAAHDALPHRDLGDPGRALDDVAFLDRRVLAEENGADLVLLEVEHHADDVVREREKLARHGLLEAVHPGDAVADLDDPAHLLEVDLGLVARERALADFADLSGVDHSVISTTISIISPLGSPPEGGSPRTADEPFIDAGELAVEAAVDDVAADLGDEAAQQIPVELLFPDHFAGAHPLAHTRAQRLALGLCERHGP